MGNTLSSCPCRRYRIRSMKEITLLMIGLDNAGKTCTTKHLLGEPTADAVPTVGFKSVQMNHGKYNVCIYDIGGGPKIRGIWQNYYALVHGLIFVVDASEPHRFEECKSEIHHVVKDQRIAGKPILLLFNKQDLENAVNEVELVNQLELESLVNQQQCPTRVEATYALYHEQKPKDTGIQQGFNWLIGHINQEFNTLSERVEKERSEQLKREEKERKERMERVQKLREEREKAAIQQQASGSSVNKEQDDDDDVIEGNPFKPIETIKKELEDKKRQAYVNPSSIPGIRVIHVSPSNSLSEKEEIILQPQKIDAESSIVDYKTSSHSLNEDWQRHPEGSRSNECSVSSSLKTTKEKTKSKKPKKRFKNRVVPEVHESFSLVRTSMVSDLPPLLPNRDVIANGHIVSYKSPKRQYSPLNGQVNRAVAERLAPSAIFTLPNHGKSDH